MRCYPNNEYEKLLGFQVEFRNWWCVNRDPLSCAYDNFDGNFDTFLKVVFNLWDTNCLRDEIKRKVKRCLQIKMK